MEALKALGYEVSPIEGGIYAEKRRGVSFTRSFTRRRGTCA